MRLSSRNCSGSRAAMKHQRRVQSPRKRAAALWLEFTARVRRVFQLAIFKCSSYQFPISIFVTEWKKIELKFNRSCSGAVFLYSQGQRAPVSADGWTHGEGHRLCRDLQCDNFVSVTKRNSSVAVWNSGIRCQGVNGTGSVWDCESKTVPTVREQKEQLVLECEGKTSY